MGWDEIEVTNENSNKVLKLLHRLHQNRQNELASFLPEHENEVEKLPQILKVRMNALKEVNPEEFSDSPELVFSTLAVAELIKRFPDGAHRLEIEDLREAHEKYHIVRGDDVNPYLVGEIFFSYFHDVESGAITKDGKIVDIEKSEVMQVYHNYREKGVPIDAKETVLKFKPTKNVPTRNNGKEME